MSLSTSLAGKGGFMEFLLAICMVAMVGCTSGEPAAGADWEKLRAEAVNRPRTLVYNTDGNDVYMGNDISDEGGNLYYNVPTTEGYAYYLLEEAAPHGHLVDPYPTDYFTIAKNDKGYYLVYQNEPEFFKLVPYLEGKI